MGFKLIYTFALPVTYLEISPATAAHTSGVPVSGKYPPAPPMSFGVYGNALAKNLAAAAYPSRLYWRLGSGSYARPSAPDVMKRRSGSKALEIGMNLLTPANSPPSPVPVVAFNGKLNTLFSGSSELPVPGKIPCSWMENVRTFGFSRVCLLYTSPSPRD